MNMLRKEQSLSDAIVSIENDDSDNISESANTIFERIPGLPYTDEEKIASIRRAEEDYAAGRFVTTDELRVKHPRL
jgi:hypothetical protein